MIVLPGYGETKTDVLNVSYFLAKNGFHTLRFDYSDHVGESDGEILYTTLTKMKEDILSCLDYLYRHFQPAAVGAVASSLASRALLRAAREDNRFCLIVNLVSVVDLRKTLFAIYNEDHVEWLLQGKPNGVMDVLGFRVDADHFLRSAIEDRYENLLTTVEDVTHIRAPLVFFSAEKDTWVDPEDVRRVFDAAASPQKDLCVLGGAMHRLYENSDAAKKALKKTVEYSLRYVRGDGQSTPVRDPDLREIGARVRMEKERYRLLRGTTKAEEREFWKDYLRAYSFVINVHDYWNLLDLIHRLLGEPASGEKILDAGCGIGNYGIYLLLKLIYRLRQSLFVPPRLPHFRYVGVDFVADAVFEGRDNHNRLKTEFIGTGPLSLIQDPAACFYCVADLESGLSFKDNVFDKICCNLVVSYLKDPREAVADMVRALKPRGRIVLTSLKPFADLSEVYRNFVRVAEGEREVKEARKLLTNAGAVRAKEAEGIYQFFSEEELTDLLKEGGITEVDTYRSFANQANVALGIKS